MSAFKRQDLLGLSEGDRLEFKAAEILRRPAKVAREVVAFLNASGGDIWIGVTEKDERAVGFDDIPSPDREVSRLTDHLLDTIEPTIDIPKDVGISVDDGLVHLAVGRGPRRPYAHLDGGRYFLKRAGARLTTMQRDELVEAFSGQSKSEDALSKQIEALSKVQTDESAKPQLWLRMTVSPALQLDFSDAAVRSQFEAWMTDPKLTGNRRGGWTFAHDATRPRPHREGLRHGDLETPWKTFVEQTGQVTFTVERDILDREAFDNKTRDLSPYTLIEFPLSVFRLMAEVLKRFGGKEERTVLVGFALGGIRGWRLRPDSPREPLVPWKKAKEFESDALVLSPLLMFPSTVLKSNPGRMAARLIGRIYQEFGFQDEDIPRELDRESGDFNLK